MQQPIPSQPAAPGAPMKPIVQGGGPVATNPALGGAFDPASVLGQTFISNAAVGPNGSVIAGGPIQIQGFVNASAGGFRTADEASKIAQQIAPSLQPGNPYARVITLQAADGNFYLYAGSVVARATAPLQQATPVGVIPAGRL
jgi:hypothetical protein